MRMSIKSCLAGLAGLAMVATAACDAATQAKLEGILQNVDSISGDVTVKLKDGSVITVNLKDVQVEALAAAVGDASLEPGTNVTIELDREQRVKKVKAHAVEVEGVIESLGTDSVTINSKGEKITLQVTPATKIEVEDADGSANFADLKVGQEVEAKYQVGATTALKIEVEDEDEDEGEDDDEGDEHEVHGAVTGVNPATGAVTIRGRNGVEATYKVMPSTKLENHGLATFDTIQMGMKVEAKFHPVTKDLMKLRVEGEDNEDDDGDEGEVEGTVTGVNPATGAVTIRGKNGVEATYKVMPSTTLGNHGRATLDVIKPGMKVEAKFHPVTKELMKLEVED